MEKREKRVYRKKVCKFCGEKIKAYNIRYLQDMPKIKFKTAMERLKDIKEVKRYSK